MAYEHCFFGRASAYDLTRRVLYLDSKVFKLGKICVYRVGHHKLASLDKLKCCDSGREL